MADNTLRIKIELLLGDLNARLQRLRGDLNNLGTGENNAKKALDSTEKSAGVLGSTVGRVSSEIKSMLAGAFAVGALVAFTSKLVETVRAVQDLRLRLSGMTQGNQDLAQSEAYLTDLAHKHHKSVQDLTASYASLLVLEKGGVTTRQQSIQLLEGLSNAGSALGATNAQIAQSVYGLSQALGQGTVQSAEFSQIIEPLTGLGPEIAKAFGADNVAQLRHWIGEGKITSEMLGQKMPEALKVYAGAAERSAGTVSASYSDVTNTYVEMAKELEKPVATAVVNVTDVGKAAYGWLKDNGNAVVNVLTWIALVTLGKGVAAINAYADAGAKAILTEQAQLDTTLASAQADAVSRAGKVAAAEIKLNERTVTAELAQAELLNAEATLQVARANELASGSSAMLVDAEIAQTAALTRATNATRSQAAADAFLISQNAKLAESQLALTAATNTSSAAMTRMAAAGRAAFSFIGGWAGVAVIAIYGVVKAVESLSDAEERASTRAMTLANSLGIMTDQVKALSAEKVDVDFSSTMAKIDELKKKLDGLSIADKVKQHFGYGVGTTLDQELEVQEQRAAALTTKKLSDTKEFDATKLPADARAGELKATEQTINERLYRIEELKASTGDKSTIDALISENQVYVAALEAKRSAIKGVIDAESNTGKIDPKIAEANAKSEEKQIASGFKLKAEYAKNAYERNLALAEKDSVKKLEIEKAYNAQSLALTLERLNAEIAAKTKTSELSGKKTKGPELQAELADLENQKLAAIDNAKTKGVTLDINTKQQADELRAKQQAAENDLALSRIDTELVKVQSEQKTELDNLKRDKGQGAVGGAGQAKGKAAEFAKGTEANQQIIIDESIKAGVDPKMMLALAAIESGGSEKAHNKSGASGLFQFMPSNFKSYGLEDDRVYDPVLNTRAAIKMVQGNAKHLEKNGFEANTGNIYLAHQQGASGAVSLLNGGSVDKQAAAQNGGVNGKALADLWTGKANATYLAMGGTANDEKQLLKQNEDKIQHYYEATTAIESKGIDARVAAIKAKLALAEQKYTTEKKTATPEELPKIEAGYATDKAKLTQELAQLQADLLAIKKDGDAEMAKEIAKAKQEEIDLEEGSALELVKVAETEAQQQLELGQLSNSKFLEKQKAFEAQRYQIALKAVQDRRALLDEGDVSGKAKSLGQEKQLATKHAADLSAINHKTALDSKAMFNSITAPIKSAFSSTIQGILQGTTTLKKGLKNMAQSIVLSFAGALSNMAIDAAAHWAWELLGFGAKETTKTVLKTTSETVQTTATVTGIASRAAAEFAGAAASKTTGLAMSSASIMDAAAKAAAGTYASVAQIPYVGWILAPPAAALAFVAVAGYKSMLSSKGGEWNVADDGVRMIHEQETILPATIAAPMRDFFTKQGNPSYSLPDSATQPQANQSATIATAASAIALQQSMMQAQQKQQRQSGGGTVVINTKGGDFVHKNDVAALLIKDKRNFRMATS